MTRIILAALFLTLAFSAGVAVGITLARDSAESSSAGSPSLSVGVAADSELLSGAPRYDGCTTEPPEGWDREPRGAGRFDSCNRGSVVFNRGAPPSPAAPTGPLVPASPPLIGASVRETSASWYCNADPSRGPLSRCTRGYPDTPGADLYAAVSADLPRGTLRVCAERCVVVVTVDCRCSSPGIDLYADAFEAIGALSRGVLAVTVKRVP